MSCQQWSQLLWRNKPTHPLNELREKEGGATWKLELGV